MTYAGGDRINSKLKWCDTQTFCMHLWLWFTAQNQNQQSTKPQTYNIYKTEQNTKCCISESSVHCTGKGGWFCYKSIYILAYQKFCYKSIYIFAYQNLQNKMQLNKVIANIKDKIVQLMLPPWRNLWTNWTTMMVSITNSMLLADAERAPWSGHCNDMHAACS